MSSDIDEKASTDDTPGSDQDPSRPLRRLRPRFGLSATQLVATALAAITATFAASYFGVAGTVLGAALVSVVTAAGKELYSQSIRSTGQRVLAVVPVTRSLPVAPTDGPADPADLPPALPARGARRVPPVAETAKWRRLAMGTMAVFVTVLAVITGVEIVAGRPVSDIVRGESGQGTSLFGTKQVRTTTVPPTAPTVTLTVTPKVVVTTPTVTRTAAPSTATTTPSSSPGTTATKSASPSSGTTTADRGNSATRTDTP